MNLQVKTNKNVINKNTLLLGIKPLVIIIQ